MIWPRAYGCGSTRRETQPRFPPSEQTRPSQWLSERELAEQQNPDVPQQEPGHQAWMRWRRVGLVVVAVVVLATILYLARGALFPFIISVVLAELLYPVVVFLEKRLPGHDRMPGATRDYLDSRDLRGFRGGSRRRSLPHDSPVVRRIAGAPADIPGAVRTRRGPRWRAGPTSSRSGYLSSSVLRSRKQWRRGATYWRTRPGGVVQRTVSGVSNAVTLVIGLVVLPFFLFYILKDREEVVGGVYPLLSQRAQTCMHTTSSSW